MITDPYKNTQLCKFVSQKKLNELHETLSPINTELFGSSFKFGKYKNASSHVHLHVEWGSEKHVKARSEFTLRETKLILMHHQYNL